MSTPDEKKEFLTQLLSLTSFLGTLDHLTSYFANGNNLDYSGCELYNPIHIPISVIHHSNWVQNQHIRWKNLQDMMYTVKEIKDIFGWMILNHEKIQSDDLKGCKFDVEKSILVRICDKLVTCDEEQISKLKLKIEPVLFFYLCNVEGLIYFLKDETLLNKHKKLVNDLGMTEKYTKLLCLPMIDASILSTCLPTVPVEVVKIIASYITVSCNNGTEIIQILQRKLFPSEAR
jgi:hypothetical protein